MKYYINCAKRSDSLAREVKELIPDMNMRRRMSRVVKMGVTTGIESLVDFDAYGQVDAIVTATWLGCVADSEKFLYNLLDSNEQMLNPTPFIQSTFNTVGAQIAQIRSMHCYNNTFTHKNSSFESAVLDAILCLDSGRARAVLVGVYDELTPTVEAILQRLNVPKTKTLIEGAFFFVLTAQPLDCSVWELSLSLGATAKVEIKCI
ncbi:MAG: beta-ketoacyl synthase chain length factor [Mucinivorans sp.]